MNRLLKKGHQGVITKLCSLDVETSEPPISLNLQRFIDKHRKVFDDIPKGIPPNQNLDNAIHLILGSVLLTSDLTTTPMSRRVKLSVWLKKC